MVKAISKKPRDSQPAGSRSAPFRAPGVQGHQLVDRQRQQIRFLLNRQHSLQQQFPLPECLQESSFHRLSDIHSQQGGLFQEISRDRPG